MPTMKYPQSRALVEKLMLSRGIDPNAEGAVAELARQTRLEPRSLYRYWSGDYRPNFDTGLEMLEKAGVIDWAAPKPDREVENADLADSIAELQEELRELRGQLDGRKPRARRR